MVKLVAGENSTLARHLINCQEIATSGRRNSITLLSKRFINRALLNTREYLVRTIVEEINNNGGCFSLLMDGSQDVSSKEQISVVVRYVNDEHIVVERTVAFFNANLNSWVDYRNIVSAHVMRRIFSQIDSTCICLQKLGLSFIEGVQSLKKCYEQLEKMKEEIKIYFGEADEFVRRSIKLLNNDAEIRAHHMNIIRLPNEREVAVMVDDLRTDFRDFVSTLKNRITEHILIHFDEEDSLYYEIQTLDPLHCSKSMSENELNRFDQLCAINNVDQSVAMQELREIIPDFFQRRNPSQYVSVLSDNDDESFESYDDDDDEITVLIGDESDFDETSADVRFQRLKFETMSELCYCSSCIVKYIGADAERSKKFANVLKLYKYIAMIPPTQVKCERDFSKMKLIKTRLCANLRDDSMENLMLISTESNMFNGIDFDDIVDYIIEKSSKLSLYMNT